MGLGLMAFESWWIAIGVSLWSVQVLPLEVLKSGQLQRQELTRQSLPINTALQSNRLRSLDVRTEETVDSGGLCMANYRLPDPTWSMNKLFHSQHSRRSAQPSSASEIRTSLRFSNSITIPSEKPFLAPFKEYK